MHLHSFPKLTVWPDSWDQIWIDTVLTSPWNWPGMVEFCTNFGMKLDYGECWSCPILLKVTQPVPTLFFASWGTTALQPIFCGRRGIHFSVGSQKCNRKWLFSASFTETITSNAFYLSGVTYHDGSHAWEMHQRCSSLGDSSPFLQWMTAHQKKRMCCIVLDQIHWRTWCFTSYPSLSESNTTCIL